MPSSLQQQQQQEPNANANTAAAAVAADSDAAHNGRVVDMLRLVATVQELRSGADEQSRVIAEVKGQLDEMDRLAAEAEERVKAGGVVEKMKEDDGDAE